MENWILIYSVYALHGITERSHFKCWCLLVESCFTLLRPVISETHIEKTHTLLVEYCKTFESLYGPERCTPNMHMCCHLKDCLLDFGPLSAFWCFPYERYNVLLEGMSKSWISPEKQMFLKFLGMQWIKQLSSLKTSEVDFLSTIYRQIYSNTADYSSFGQTKAHDNVNIRHIHNILCEVSALDAVRKGHECLIPPYKEKCFNDAEISYLKEMYKFLYPTLCLEKLSRFYRNIRMRH